MLLKPSILSHRIFLQASSFFDSEPTNLHWLPKIQLPHLVQVLLRLIHALSPTFGLKSGISDYCTGKTYIHLQVWSVLVASESLDFRSILFDAYFTDFRMMFFRQFSTNARKLQRQNLPLCDVVSFPKNKAYEDDMLQHARDKHRESYTYINIVRMSSKEVDKKISELRAQRKVRLPFTAFTKFSFFRSAKEFLRLTEHFLHAQQYCLSPIYTQFFSLLHNVIHLCTHAISWFHLLSFAILPFRLHDYCLHCPLHSNVHCILDSVNRATTSCPEHQQSNPVEERTSIKSPYNEDDGIG